MTLFENPFYLLNLTPKDSRRTIVQRADEYALYHDAEKCADARNILTNPQRRISAEVHWILDTAEQEIELTLDTVKSAEIEEDLSQFFEDEYLPLSDLNVWLTRNDIIDVSDVFKAKYMVLRYSRLYESITADYVINIINESRSVSGFPLVENDEDVLAALAELKNEIKHAIFEHFDELSPEMYSEVMAMLSESYSSNPRYKGQEILEEVLNTYQINTLDASEAQKEKIIRDAEVVSNSVGVINLEAAIAELLKDAKAWNKSIYPVRKSFAMRGETHIGSVHVFNALIDLYDKLAFEHEELACAETVLYALLELYSDVPECVDILENKKEVLEQEIRFYSLKKKYSRIDGTEYEVVLNENSFRTPRFCMRCMEPTDETIKYVEGCDLPVCSKCQAKKKRVVSERRIKQELYNEEAEKEAKKWLVKGAWISALIACVLFAALLFFGATAFWSGVISVVAGIVSLNLFSKREFPLKKLGYDVLDATDTNGFAAIKVSRAGPVFRFTNGAYATLFAEGNKAAMRVLPIGLGSNKSPKEFTRFVAANEWHKTFSHIRTIMTVALIVLFVLAGAVLAWNNDSYSSDNTPSYSSKPTTTAKPNTVLPKPSNTTKKPVVTTPPLVAKTLPSNGHVFYSKNYYKPCQFEVTNKDTRSYYMKFVDIYTGEDIITFFVRANSKATIDMPTGDFELRYAVGSTWYGETDLFGPDTRYAKDKEYYPFESDDYSSTIWQVSFYASTAGGSTMYTESMDKDEF